MISWERSIGAVQLMMNYYMLRSKNLVHKFTGFNQVELYFQKTSSSFLSQCSAYFLPNCIVFYSSYVKIHANYRWIFEEAEKEEENKNANYSTMSLQFYLRKLTFSIWIFNFWCEQISSLSYSYSTLSFSHTLILLLFYTTHYYVHHYLWLWFIFDWKLCRTKLSCVH